MVAGVFRENQRDIQVDYQLDDHCGFVLSIKEADPAKKENDLAGMAETNAGRNHYTMKLLTLVGIAVLAFVGCRADAQMMTNVAFVVDGNSGPCPGDYDAKTGWMRNNTNGALYVTVPAGASTLGAVCQSQTNANTVVVRAFRVHDGATKCDTNSVAWNVGPLDRFRFEVFWIGTTPPPTNGELVSVLVKWK